MRSYDPQLGRFLQSDPYDQFASGYAGIGNDPANNVDPTGGAIPGIGCAATCGMSGYGGMVSRIGSSLNIANALSTAVSIAGTTSKALGFINQIGQYQQNLSQFSQLGSFASFTDWFRDWKPQYTKDFLGAAYRSDFFKNHYGSGNKYPAVTRLGRIYEDAVLRSLELDKNTQNMGGSIPDAVAVIPSKYLELNSSYVKGYLFPDAAFIDAKFRAYVPFDGQMDRMITALSSQTGGYEIDSRYGQRWRSDLKASDLGAATLILITPVNAVLDSRIVSYAKQMRVKVIQEFTEFDSANPNRMRLSGWGHDLIGGGKPVEMSQFFSSSSVLINWNVR